MLPGSRLTLLLPLLIPVSLGAQEPAAPFERTLVSVQFATFVPDLGPGRFSVLQYLTDVAAGGRAIETVSLARQADGSWRVVGYFVRPL